MYGHLDKQPEMEGWDDDLGPWKPVIKDEKLYGRGGADDGYALFWPFVRMAFPPHCPGGLLLTLNTGVAHWCSNCIR